MVLAVDVAILALRAASALQILEPLKIILDQLRFSLPASGERQSVLIIRSIHVSSLRSSLT